MKTTTLRKLVRHNPSPAFMARLLEALNKISLDDEPLPLSKIAQTLGIDSALWAVRALEPAEIADLVCFYAENVIHPACRPEPTIKVVRDFLEEKVSYEELLKGTEEALASSQQGDSMHAVADWAARAAIALNGSFPDYYLRNIPFWIAREIDQSLDPGVSLNLFIEWANKD